MPEDRIQTIDYKFLLHEELSDTLKSEIRNPKPETNSKIKCSNDQNEERDPFLLIIGYWLICEWLNG